ncbi:hypothetical protein NP493_70g01038 [Ridgeia piscesae]|uniref:SH3 domain-containing protein n=1 Tax=Ridgeia piscesae TaxID=27915 RepID=A0AAD9P9N0_RIDPI|nr:hypothetical protein NP493_70g01038 [Ridgeia piscesae]
MPGVMNGYRDGYRDGGPSYGDRDGYGGPGYRDGYGGPGDRDGYRGPGGPGPGGPGAHGYGGDYRDQDRNGYGRYGGPERDGGPAGLELQREDSYRRPDQPFSYIKPEPFSYTQGPTGGFDRPLPPPDMYRGREEPTYQRREEPAYQRRGEPNYGRRDAPPLGPRDNYIVPPVADFVPSERHKYVLDHLATFTVGKQDLLYPDDGMRKLRQMEMTTGVWTMQVTMQVESRDLVIIDRQSEEEMERFPLNLITDPTAIMNDDRRDVYNNILLFTISGDTYQHTPSEMHIFQCKSTTAQSIVDDLRAAIHSSSRRGNDRGHSHPTGPAPRSPYGPPPPVEMPPQWQEYEQAAKRSAMAAAAYMPGPDAGAAFRQSIRPPPQEEEPLMTESVDRDVQLLNHCFDDIEKFVGRLQYAAEAFRELDRRREGRDRRRGMGGEAVVWDREKGKKGWEAGLTDSWERGGWVDPRTDGMLTMRARPPPAKDFIDIFQKFKLAFNLLAKLRKHLHDPNAPELVHFLITPLSLIVEASKDPGHGTPDLASKVVSPLLTAEAKELLKNCLTSKEADLWLSLGDAWTVSRDQWKGYVPPYTPRFTDGWNPEPKWFTDSSQDVVTAAVIAHQQNHADDNRIKFTAEREDPYGRRGVRTPPPIHDDREDPYARRGVRTPPPIRDDREDPYARRGVRTPPPVARPFDDPYAHSGMVQRARSPPPVDRRAPPVMDKRREVDPTYAGFQKRKPQPTQMEESSRAPPGFNEDQQAFRNELLQKGAKVVEVMHEREGRNQRELSVQKGEYLEVMDESRNWWKLRNSKGAIGHAPYTILSDLDGEASSTKSASQESRSAAPAAVSRSKSQFSRSAQMSSGQNQQRRELKADLRNELKQRVTSVKSQLEQRPRHYMPSCSVSLTDRSSAQHVIAWLKAKGFKAKTLHMLDGTTGKQLFEMDRSALERLVGQEQGTRLDSQLTIQKNIAGYQTSRTKELLAALQRQKEKTDGGACDDVFLSSPFEDGSFYYNFKTSL